MQPLDPAADEELAPSAELDGCAELGGGAELEAVAWLDVCAELLAASLLEVGTPLLAAPDPEDLGPELDGTLDVAALLVPTDEGMPDVPDMAALVPPDAGPELTLLVPPKAWEELWPSVTV